MNNQSKLNCKRIYFILKMSSVRPLTLVPPGWVVAWLVVTACLPSCILALLTFSSLVYNLFEWLEVHASEMIDYVSGLFLYWPTNAPTHSSVITRQFRSISCTCYYCIVAAAFYKVEKHHHLNKGDFFPFLCTHTALFFFKDFFRFSFGLLASVLFFPTTVSFDRWVGWSKYLLI